MVDYWFWDIINFFKKKNYCKVSFYNLIQSCRSYLVMAPIKMLVMCRKFYLKYIGSLVAVCCEVLVCDLSSRFFTFQMLNDIVDMMYFFLKMLASFYWSQSCFTSSLVVCYGEVLYFQILMTPLPFQ